MAKDGVLSQKNIGNLLFYTILHQNIYDN